MSFKAEVVADDTGTWSGNALRFATPEEASAYAHDLMIRWFAVRDTRVVECDDLVNYRYDDHKLVEVKTEAEPKPGEPGNG
jgi:hypothetical protein